MTRTADPVRRRRPWDVALGIALTLVVLVLAAVLGVAGALLVMASDPCGAVACAEDRLSLGVLVAIIAPSVVAVVTIVAVIERIVRARRTFWVPLVGLGVQLSVWAGAAALVASAVPS